ncbi:MAG: hypothetical protein K6F50_02040 [Kiritimatiellae bacterium]|nr:hypothetical protein [Kiritimatiellia bacterium]
MTAKTIRLALAALAGAILAGCVADSAEDTDLPWATNQPWEGIAPLGPSVMNRYD